jgi:tRNA-dihydrouridine synthase
MLAPMAEISHQALRELIEGFGGCDEYFTEMISAPALLGGGPFERWYINNGPRPEKLVYQLVGADIGQMAGAASLLNERECAGIDLNMGCCAPLIRKTGAGIAWMASVDRAGELVRELRKRVKRRLSVKIRTGFTDDFEYLLSFCRRLEAEGVELITLHPRTAKEKLKRLARWDYVRALRQELSIPLAGNGDIGSAEDLVNRSDGSCDAVMVGRAAVRKPWIFAEARKMAPEINVFDTGLRFLELLGRWQPPEFHISRARRFFSFFCDNLKWGNHVKNQINREETLSGMERVWKEHFSNNEENGFCEKQTNEAVPKLQFLGQAQIPEGYKTTCTQLK